MTLRSQHMQPPDNSRKATTLLVHEASDLRLAFGVLREPFAWGVMLISLVGAVLVLAGLGALVVWLLTGGGGLLPSWMLHHAWVQWLAGGLGTVVYLIAAWFLFPVIVTAVAGVFLESLADRIERRHYPELPAARQIPLGEQARVAIRSLARGIGWNLLALPLYLIPMLNVVAYGYINARLLSREYFQVVALRHLPAADTTTLYQRHHWQMLRGGLVLMGFFMLPLVQLAAPLFATAWSVHRLWRRPDAILRRTLPAAATDTVNPEPTLPPPRHST